MPPARRMVATFAMVAALLVSLVGGGRAHAADTTNNDPDVLTASQHWEAWNVDEPNVWHAGGQWWMLYTGGWARSAFGLANSSSLSGPWRKSADPVVADGRAGIVNAYHANVYVAAGVAYAYFTSPHGDLIVATADAGRPFRWTVRKTVLRRTGAADYLANSTLAAQGGRYVMLVESRTKGAGCCRWQTGLATGSSPLGPFTMTRFPLTSLRVGDRTGMYGGPDLVPVLGGWRLYYHASVHGPLPTDIYTATSRDLIHWSDKQMVVRHSGWHDQAADMFVVRTAAGSVGFYSAMDNPMEFGSIQRVTLPWRYAWAA